MVSLRRTDYDQSEGNNTIIFIRTYMFIIEREQKSVVHIDKK